MLRKDTLYMYEIKMSTNIRRQRRNMDDMHVASPPKTTTQFVPRGTSLLYGVEDVPSVPLLLLFAIQQAIMTISSTMSVPFLLSNLLCAGQQTDVTAKLLSVTMFMCGIATVLQCFLGIRIGIIQGGSHTFIAPVLAMMTLEKWACPDNISEDKDSDIWKERMRELQGNLMLASLVQLVLGLTGAVGFLLRFIGPLTVAPTIALIGLAFIDVVVAFSEKHWGISFLTMMLVLTFSAYLEGVNMPYPYWSEQEGWHRRGFPLFQLFPIILSIAVSWTMCLILTKADVLPTSPNKTGYYVRTDVRADVLEKAPWIYWPYPFQFGRPTVSGAGFVGMLAATLSSVIESVGDYYAAARMSQAPPPPSHAVNRGIAVEGLASIVSGMVGSGHGTTSYSGNIGAIGITKVASRRVFITAGFVLIFCGVFGKFGAFLAQIPDPIIGGSLVVMLGLAGATGLSVLKFVNLDSMRNLIIIGVSLLLGLMVPGYVNKPVNAGIINTGSPELDQTIKVMLGTAMFVGGVTGFILDNSIPGTEEERGISVWRSVLANPSQSNPYIRETDLSIYDIPFITKWLKSIKTTSYCPIMPTFEDSNSSCIKMCRCCQRNGKTVEITDETLDSAGFRVNETEMYHTVSRSVVI